MESLLYSPFPNFGKFGKFESLENILLLLQPLWATVLSLVHAKRNKDHGSAQAVQDEVSLTPAALRAGFLFGYTSYFVTVGLSNTVQLPLLANYSVMLELLESLLCCLARHFFFFLLFIFSFSSSVSFPGVKKTCCSTSVCQALRNQTYTNALVTFRSCNWFCHG